MANILVSWIGGNDLQAMQSEGSETATSGPLLSTLNTSEFCSRYVFTRVLFGNLS